MTEQDEKQTKITKNTMQEWVRGIELDYASKPEDERQVLLDSSEVWDKVRERVGLKPLSKRDLLQMNVTHLEDEVTSLRYRSGSPDGKAAWVKARKALHDAEGELLSMDDEVGSLRESLSPSAVVTSGQSQA